MKLLLSLVGILGLFLVSLTPWGVRFRRWCMARLYVRVQREFEIFIAERKQQLLADLSGTVLEIGPGNGPNFPYLPPEVDCWIGLEPNPYMHEQLRASAAERELAAEFRVVSAEGMEVEDQSVDAVLSTLVLCSVPDPAAVIADVHRVLKPGGQFVFLEHVAAPRGSRLRRVQSLVRPLWSYIADGCRPDRDLGDMIQSGGFAQVSMDRFTAPPDAMPAVVSRLIAGVAVKGAAERSW